MEGWQTLVLVSMLWITFTSMFKEAVANTKRSELPAGNSGFISIDCGVEEDYVDEESGISYKSDKDFISTGRNHDVPGSIASESFFKTTSKNLRSFPKGRKNCYALRPDQGKNHNYIIRAFFNYANYDGMNKPPQFDMYIGVNRWVTIEGLVATGWWSWELIHFSLSDTILVCLVNTNSGVPFISALELRPLNNFIYTSDSGSLTVISRYQPSPSLYGNFKYKDDAFDRIWETYKFANDTVWANATSDLEVYNTEDPYKLPIEVLRSAVQPRTGNSLSYSDECSSCQLYYVYFHFAETVNIPKGQHRELTITLNDLNYGPFTLQYLKPLTIPLKSPTPGSLFFTINSTNSDLPPILNAFEILNVLQLPDSPTDQADVDAIMAIKQLYNIEGDEWQGDPCVPRQLSWNVLKCSYGNTPPNIISLDLSSRILRGDIASQFSNLKAMQSLDLSNNKLSGTVPEFLAELQNLTRLNLSFNELTGPVPESLGKMPNLVTLNLSGNRFTGSIPHSLLEKSNIGILELSFDKNPDLCQVNSCEKRKNFLLPVVASIISVLVLLLLSIIAIFWRNRRRRELQTSKDRSFSYAEIVSITDNFTTIIGGGGFGKVYLGTLKDGTKVAVKLLSQSSKQGSKEFQAEVQLLLIVHHRNLVSLIGYCNDHHNMALIYEYMARGNLHENLTETSGSTLTWKERLQIAVDAAYGLEYLHNGCKPSIIHRDLKTSNILLNEKLQAKISDFGLSRAFTSESGSHITTFPAGTFGYMDPEAQASGIINKKSDVYSFGIILLELITGRAATTRNEDGNLMFLNQWVRPIINKGNIQDLIDSRLKAGEFDTNSAWKAVEIAMSCVPNSALQRPDMSQVLAELQECLATLMADERNSLEMSYQEPDSDMRPSAR